MAVPATVAARAYPPEVEREAAEAGPWDLGVERAAG
jgi:hypothetical protein